MAWGVICVICWLHWCSSGANSQARRTFHWQAPVAPLPQMNSPSHMSFLAILSSIEKWICSAVSQPAQARPCLFQILVHRKHHGEWADWHTLLQTDHWYFHQQSRLDLHMIGFNHGRGSTAMICHDHSCVRWVFSPGTSARPELALPG